MFLWGTKAAWLPHWRDPRRSPRAAAVITKSISSAYKAKTGIDATIFSSRPASGATIMKG
jgi:hypothetical protein